MGIQNLIDGFQTLQPFYDKPSGYHVGSDHDVIYAYRTDKPISEEAIEKMISLGWHQEHDGRDYEKDFSRADYSEDESWHFYT